MGVSGKGREGGAGLEVGDWAQQTSHLVVHSSTESWQNCSTAPAARAASPRSAPRAWGVQTLQQQALTLQVGSVSTGAQSGGPKPKRRLQAQQTNATASTRWVCGAPTSMWVPLSNCVFQPMIQDATYITEHGQRPNTNNKCNGMLQGPTACGREGVYGKRGLGVGGPGRGDPNPRCD